MATKVLLNQLTVAEQAKRRGADGNIVTIAELLEEVNEILVDAPMFEANDTFSHLATVRDKLPTVSPRRINEGASKSASSTRQVRESIMLLDTFCEIDEALIDHEPDPKKSRWNEVKSFLEATALSFSEAFWYGNYAVDPKEMLGLVPRFNALALPNVHAVGATSSGSDQTSVWFIEYGERKLHLIFPRGAKDVGVSENDLGKIRVTDPSGNPLMAYVSQIKAEFGLAVIDNRAAQRLCNIDTSTLGTNDFLAGTNSRQLLVAKNQLPRMGENAVLYANRYTKTQFDIWALEKTNGFYTVENVTGRPLTVFQGIPIRMSEQILNTEAVVA